jgi:hypothetical protein
VELRESIVKLTHKILIFSRIGNEDIGHGAYQPTRGCKRVASSQGASQLNS